MVKHIAIGIIIATNVIGCEWCSFALPFRFLLLHTLLVLRYSLTKKNSNKQAKKQKQARDRNKTLIYLSIITGSDGVSFRFPQLFLSQHRLFCGDKGIKEKQRKKISMNGETPSNEWRCIAWHGKCARPTSNSTKFVFISAKDNAIRLTCHSQIRINIDI